MKFISDLFKSKIKNDYNFDLVTYKNIKITTLYTNIYHYRLVNNYLLDFDFKHRLVSSDLPNKKITSMIILDWITDDEDYINYEEVTIIFKELITGLDKLKDIRDILEKTNSNIFNFKYLQIYITNVENIVNLIKEYKQR